MSASSSKPVIVRSVSDENYFSFIFKVELITNTKTSHLDSLWRGGRQEIGNLRWLQRNWNACPLRCRCNFLPTELWSLAVGSRYFKYVFISFLSTLREHMSSTNWTAPNWVLHRHRRGWSRLNSNKREDHFSLSSLFWIAKREQFIAYLKINLCGTGAQNRFFQ